ncbi:MAG: ExbD/TolR family protein [Nannocystales bacterium]
MKIGQLSNEVTEGAELNITPLIDIVFILLIFFVVTTTFVHELGLPIERPDSSTATEQPHDVVRVAVSRQGEVTVDAQPTSPWRVEAEVRARLREHADASVIVIADKGSTAEVIVDAIDACRRAGADGVALGVAEGAP